MEHTLPQIRTGQLERPWRTATLVACLVAALELVVLVVLGVALLAEPVCDGDLGSGALVPVLDAYEPDVGGIWLVTHGRRQLAARVRAFVALAREHHATRTGCSPES